MLIFWAVLGGFLLDALFGDPEWLPNIDSSTETGSSIDTESSNSSIDAESSADSGGSSTTVS